MLLREKRKLTPDKKDPVEDFYKQKKGVLGRFQSARGVVPTWMYGDLRQLPEHQRACFEQMLRYEHTFGTRYAVFYHLYIESVILYEVQAALAHLLYGFDNSAGVLPRLDSSPFSQLPDAESVSNLVTIASFKQDHDVLVRSATISANTTIFNFSVLQEAAPISNFARGYNMLDGIRYKELLENVLRVCAIRKTGKIVEKILQAAQQCGLCVHANAYKGEILEDKPCPYPRGHCLQIFLRRDLVDSLVYPCFGYGVRDFYRSKESLSRPDKSSHGQVRICFRPDVFMDRSKARLFAFSSDPKYHDRRHEFQQALVRLFTPLFGRRKKEQR